MRAIIKPSRAEGRIKVPYSKSIAHRLLIAASLSEEKSVIRGITPCEDILATIDCLSALGAKIKLEGDTATVEGKDMKSIAPSRPLNCRESGSTLRFLIPIAALSGAKVLFAGSDRLMERPLSVYEKLFEDREMLLARYGGALIVDGPLASGEIMLDGSVSSQFISGLLFALPLTEGDSIIRITPPFESRPYVDLTLAALGSFGISAEFTDEYTLRIPGSQSYRGGEFDVEGDWSAAAFIDAFSLLDGDATAIGLNESSLQGDKIYKAIYEKLSCGRPTVDISDCPDLAPILFALAAAKNGAVFTGTKRLKHKECERAEAMALELAKLGGYISIDYDKVTVRASKLHAPNEPISAHGDHRIAMAMTVILSTIGGEIDGAEAVKKSYPEFFEDIKKLGIDVMLYD